MANSGSSGESAPQALAASTDVETLRNGRFVVVGLLGRGSQGETLEAVDKRDGRLVALKRFRIRGAPSWKDVELAEREARVLATLKHPALPAYIDHFEEGGCLYLAMQKIEGVTLSEYRRKGGVAAQDVVAFLEQAASLLEHLHGRAPPIIHRDINPKNVIRRSDGSYVFVDFGSVRDTLKPDGGSTVVGTYGFMAPEQFQGRALPVSDVYAVAATALSLLTGRDPSDLPHRGLKPDVTAALGSRGDARLRAVLDAALEPDPDRRPEQLGELLKRHGVASSKSRFRGEAPRERLTAQGPREATGRRAPRAPHEARRGIPRGLEDDASRLLDMLLLAPFVVPLTRLGLLVARLSVWALFDVFLPVLLMVLSIAFGRPLRRAAIACSEVGRGGRAGIHQAEEAVIQRAGEARNRSRSPRRVRVASRTRVRAPSIIETAGESVEDESEEAGRAPTTRASDPPRRGT